jgi:hypothetical protein
VNNDNSNNTAITTAITNAKTDIINNDNSNKDTIVNNDNSNKTTIINNDNSNKDTIVNNDNANRTTIVNNDNTNKTTIVNNDNANTLTLNTAITNAKNEIIANANQNKADLLRTQIEADLRAENVAVVAWFMTPTASGGHLNFVRQIVTETITNLRLANVVIGITTDPSLDTAQRYLDSANADTAAGRYRLAYDTYRKAYKAIVNQPIRVPGF